MPQDREHFIQELSRILAQEGAIKDKEVPALIEDFKARSELPFEEFLIHENLVGRSALLHALGSYYTVPVLDVRGIFFDHHLVTMFPKELLLEYTFIPYLQDGDVLVVIAAEPNNADLPELIGKFVSYDVVFMVGYFRDIQDSIEEYYDPALTQEPQTGDEDVREEREEERYVHDLEEFG